ncbi:hypothetical protein V2J09_006464 [Rumex salicifolius]
MGEISHILGNQMEDKQLNFNRPLLSVRRGSSTSALPDIDNKEPTNPPSNIPHFPYYKPELKSDPMSDPAAVPFKWEQIPGRAKLGDRKLQTRALMELPPVPKLPPGRVVSTDEKPSHKPSNDSFSSESQRGFDGVCISNYYKNAGENEPLECDREENESSNSEGDDDSTYLDAVDRLSQSESFLNCSVSGLDDPGMESSGTFLDPQTRDFMMGRFLPAAKAVTSETPQFGSRKQQPVVKEKPIDVKKVVMLDKQIPSYYYTTPTSLNQYLKDVREEEDDDDDDDDDDQEEEEEDEEDETQKAIKDAVYERRRLTIYQKSNLRIGANDELIKQNPQHTSLKVDEPSRVTSLESISIVPYRSVSHDSLMSKETGFLGIPTAIKNSGDAKLKSYKRRLTRFPELLADETAEEHEYSNSGDLQIQQYRFPDADALQIPLSLPKCPSESWLSHALPSMSSRRPLSKSLLSAKNLTMKPSLVEPKWEALVKSSSLHNNNLGLPGVGSLFFHLFA